MSYTDILRPIASGAYTEFTPTGGPTNWGNAITALDGKTNYDHTYYNGIKDAYRFNNPVKRTGYIESVTVGGYIGIAASIAQRKFLMRINNVDYWSSNDIVGPGYSAVTWALNPATNAPWVITDLDYPNFQAGLWIYGTGVPSGVWIDSLYVQVNFAGKEPCYMILELAFGQSIFTVDPTWTDVTQDLKSLHTKRGRMHELDKVEAGTAVFKLDNADGDWWRNNTAGIHTPDVKPLTLIRLRGMFNGITYPVYYGVTESFRPGWESDRGGFTPIMEIGAVDVFKCFTRYKIVDANPLITAGASGGYTVTVDSTYGLVAGQTIKVYSATQTSVNIIVSINTITKVVTLMNILMHNYTNGHLKKFPAGLSGRRIMDILLEVGWPLALTNIDYGQVEVIEISPAATGTNAMEALYDTVASEDGNLFVSASGIVTFHDSIARTKAPYNASVATFKDTGASSQFVLPELVDDDSFIYNEADISGDGIDQQVMLDEDAQALQGPRALVRASSLIYNSCDANTQAFIIVKRFSTSALRPETLLVLPVAEPDDLYPKTLGYDLATRLTLQINSTRNPALLDQAYHIEGVTHDWSALTDLWQTTWQLWEVNKYRVYKAVHDGFLLNIDDTTSYEAAHDAPTASHAPFNDDESGLDVGQWITYAGSIYLSARIERGYLEFDTSNMDVDDVILAAHLLIRIEAMYLDHDYQLCLVPSGGVDNPLVVADYGTLHNQATDYGKIDIEPPAGYRVIDLTAAGIAAISKGGTTRFALRTSRDIGAINAEELSKEFVTIAGLNYYDGKFLPRLIVRME